MTFPDYIPTRTVTAGKAFALETAAPLPVKISVRASRSLIWGATGYRFEAVGAAATGEGFDEASLELPVTDLNGWRDANTRAEIEISEEGFQTHSHTYSADVTVGSKTYKIGPFVLPSGTGDIDLDLVVPTGTEAGTSVLIPDEWSRVASEAAEEARKAAEDARSAADDAQAVLTQDAATAWGFFPVLSETPPGQSEMFGVPVIWIDPTERAFLTPVVPPPVVWNDFDSTFTIPEDDSKVFYSLTPEGGFLEILAPGSTHTTSGSFPRKVVVYPIPQPGYTLAAGNSRYEHNFPDPTNITLLVSESFSGEPVSTLSGRPLDMYAGGVVNASWANTTGQGWGISENETAFMAGTTGHNAIILGGDDGAYNFKVEFDIVSYSGEGNFGSGQGFLFSALGGTAGGSVGMTFFGAAYGVFQITTSNGRGGASMIRPEIPYGPGTWAFQLYETTFTVTLPDGTNIPFDLSDSFEYNLPTKSPYKEFAIRTNRPETHAEIDNIKIYRVGF